MTINIDLMNQRVDRMLARGRDLQIARNLMVQFRQDLESYWQSSEAVYVIRAVDETISKIDLLIEKINLLPSKIKPAVDQIIAEETEVLQNRAFNQQKKQEITALQKEYDELRKKYETEKQLLENLKKNYGDSALFRTMKNQYSQAAKKVDQMEVAVQSALQKLNKAKGL